MEYHDSDAHEGESMPKKVKRAKPARACDACRRRRIRCDGTQGSDVPCSNCVTFRSECTYDEPPKKHGPPKGYTKILEDRVSLLENMLRNVGVDVEKELGGPLDKESIRQGVLPERPRASRTGLYDSPTLATDSDSAAGSPSQANAVGTTDASEDEDILYPVIDKFEELSLNPMQERFLGKSSGYGLIKAALTMKGYNEQEVDDPAKGPDPWNRPRFWTMQPWELGVEKRPDYQFPEPDLMAALLKLHYDKVHSLSPVLHWPTFERGVREGLHLRDYRFGAVLMMVCATAARYSDDPRVMLEGHDSPASAGWKWFHQVQDARKSMLAPTTLYDLQLYSLLGTFLIGSSAPHAAWIAIGHGIRMAQDVGAHRRKFYGDRYTVKSELWKRAFWALILHDRGLSAALGRPYTLSPKEIDVELPVECDDEYWITSNPDDAFKQPAGKPTRMTFFIHMIKMNDVLGDTLRVFYEDLPTAKPSTPEQDQQMIAELDSALNNWFDGIPPHLRWMPHDGDPVTFRQSAMLHVGFYRNQILIHRPLISSAPKPSLLSASCMAICSNAARCLINVADVIKKHGDFMPASSSSTFTACVILVLQILGLKQSGTLMDPEKAMSDVRKGLDVLESMEDRWAVAGACSDIVRGLASMGKLPLPPQRAASKRRRDTGSSVMPGGLPLPTTAEHLPRPPDARVSPHCYGTQDSGLRQPVYHHSAPNPGPDDAEPQVAGPSRLSAPVISGVPSSNISWSGPDFPGEVGPGLDIDLPASGIPGLASTDENSISAYLPSRLSATSSSDQMNEHSVLDHFMSSMADPNLNADFYPTGWPQTTSMDVSWNRPPTDTADVAGNIVPSWTDMPIEMTQWEAYFQNLHDFGV